MTNNNKSTIRVQRRRRSEPPPGGRPQAPAPQRRRPDSSSRPSSGGSSSGGGGIRPRPFGSGGTSLPGGGGGSWVWAIVLLLLLVVGGPLLGMFNGDRSESDTPIAEVSDTGPTATPRPRATAVPLTTADNGQTWLVMLYQDADDQILEQDIYVDLNEAERVGSTDRVQIVAQVDRFRAGYQGDGNWSSAKRFYITQDEDLQRVHSTEIADLGEVNMSDGATLVDFVTWAMTAYPADNYVLILSDHGMGWPGGWSDPAPGSSGGGSDDGRIPLVATLGDELYLMELDAALAQIRQETGLAQFALIGLDACLMGHLEVFAALEPHAHYAVASQETEPALGWAYTGFLQALVENPGMSGADLSRLIVASYIQDDQRIVDDQARAEYLRQGSPMGGLFNMLGSVSADQLTQQMEQNVTLTAVDLTALPALRQSVDALSLALQGGNQSAVARARTYAQSFTNVFGQNVPPAYIDLGSFVKLLRQEIGNSIVAPANEVLAALDGAVIAEKHGPNKPGAMGVSIYFPNSQLFQHPATGPESYTAVADRFAAVSLWDEFLAYHYTGAAFTAQSSGPALGGTAVRGPGAGTVTVSPITQSAAVATADAPVLLSADIQGQNIGYVYLFVGFYDQAANSIFVADSDYLESTETQQIDGLYYPVWGETEFTLEFEWQPLMFAIGDGQSSVTAVLTPQTYGASYQETIYTVDGLYTYADDGETRYARLYFQDGLLRQVFGFTGETETGAPREIIPQAGDTFTVLEQWLDLDSAGQVSATSTQRGGTLTFGEQMFTWEGLEAAPGEYIVGFIVTDLDGGETAVYTRITVE